MGKNGLIAIGLIALSATRLFAAERLSDAEISKKLVGSWIVPPDSTDYDPGSPYSLETFKPDGTYTLFIFGDPACQAVVRQTQVKWTIEHGVLITILPNGSELRDEVHSIESGILTLRSLEDGATYTRWKALTCSRAVEG
jgi:hypothetical protein